MVSKALSFLFIILKMSSVHNQWWGYPGCNSYTYGQPYYQQMGYSMAYPDYQSYRPEEPTVIVINGEDDDEFGLMDIIAFLASRQDQSGGPVYIPYPVPMDSYGCSGYSNSDCCKNNGECCKCQNYDNDCNCNCKKPTSCGCNSGNAGPSCGCNKCIKHKNNCDCF